MEDLMKRWIRGMTWLALGCVAALGAQQNPTAGRGMGQMGGMQHCQMSPMTLSGADVAVADTTTGIAITFTAKAGDVKELQRRVERLANMHTMMSDAPQMNARMIPGDVKYEAIAGGARLTLTPKDPAKLAEFRSQVRTHVEQMKKGNCAMMEEMMHGMMMQGRGGMMRGSDSPAPGVK
jgi:hypothetical protein